MAPFLGSIPQCNPVRNSQQRHSSFPLPQLGGGSGNGVAPSKKVYRLAPASPFFSETRRVIVTQIFVVRWIRDEFSQHVSLTHICIAEEMYKR
jgi:hypothetical protein